MLRFALLMVFRNFKRFKDTFFINLIGLSIGMSCAMLIYLWVNDELSVDKFHKRDPQLYQVMENQVHEEGVMTTDGTAGLLADAIKAEMPEVEQAVAVAPPSSIPRFVLQVGDKKLKAVGQFADKEYFSIFSFDLLKGNKEQVLADKSSIVISETLARKLFQTADGAIGKSIEWQHPDIKKEAIITGVFKDLPFNSSAQFDFVLPYDIFKELYPDELSWGNYGRQTFLILNPGVNIASFNARIANSLKKKDPGNDYRTVFVRKFSTGYLYDGYENGVLTGGRIEYVRLFSIIAIIILLIACINFMNLSTAKATTRLKEVGVKKAVGAGRGSLILQYMGESILISFFALIVALVIVLMLLPHFNDLVNKQLGLHFNGTVIFGFLSITLITGILAGTYPALYLSGFNPALILKGKLLTSLGELLARKGLVVFQFTLSVVLIVAVWVVYKQIEFVQTKKPGFKKDNVIYFEKDGQIITNMQTFLAELKNIPGVENASSIEDIIIGSHSTTVGMEWRGKNPDEMIKFENVTVNYGLIETLGIEMKEGRPFSRNFPSDSTGNIIFNEAAIKQMGIKDPIGKKVRLWGGDRVIVGVTKDFHFQTLHQKVHPLFFKIKPQGTQLITVRLQAGNETQTIERIAKLYQVYNPGGPFEYRFLDEDYQAQYVAEKSVAVLSRYFAGLAIILSCLGLFGLATFTAQRRFKEIGIRKVLGSSESSIVYLLSIDFTKLVIIAVIIALPGSYLLVKYWLDGFAYKISLQFWYFLGAGLAALFIAWATVALQAIKAAKMNPLKSLRSE